MWIKLCLRFKHISHTFTGKVFKLKEASSQKDAIVGSTWHIRFPTAVLFRFQPHVEHQFEISKK